MTSDPDDSELIARSLDGDDDAFVAVVRRHEAAVGAYLARRAGRTWPRTFSARCGWPRSGPGPATTARSPTGPWLFGVAHNTLRRHWRSRPAGEPFADVAGLASGWDPWTAVDHRVDVEPLRGRVLDVLLLVDGLELPDLRAGVLRIMATMPNVKVTHTSTAGQAARTWPPRGQDVRARAGFGSCVGFRAFIRSI